MHKKYSSALRFTAIAALVFLTGVVPVQAQVLPAPGAKLNYTQVMFEYEKISGVQEYVVELSSPSRTGDAGQVVLIQRDTTTATLISGLQFGKKYVHTRQYKTKNASAQEAHEGPRAETPAAAERRDAVGDQSQGLIQDRPQRLGEQGRRWNCRLFSAAGFTESELNCFIAAEPRVCRRDASSRV